jgi:UDP-N-acetyl-D-glucosamine dehydrogenase
MTYEPEIAVVGCGYVGLQTLVGFAKEHHVIGIDIEPLVVDSINSGTPRTVESYVIDNFKSRSSNIFASTNIKDAEDCSTYFICVPTPVGKSLEPDYSALESAVKDVSTVLKDDDVIILESTVPVGAIDNHVLNILDKSGKRFYFAHCPEFVDPGNERWHVENIPRVVGGMDLESADIVAKIYQQILKGKILYSDQTPFRSIVSERSAGDILVLEGTPTSKAYDLAAEAKTFTNSQRLINIGFAMQQAMVCDQAGLDITQILAGAAMKPFAFQLYYPGPGIGGQCVGMDPILHINEVGPVASLNHGILRSAIQMISRAPIYTVERMNSALNNVGKPMNGAKIAVLGLAYKAEEIETLASPASAIKDELTSRGAKVLMFDPHIPPSNKGPLVSDVSSIEEALSFAEAIILVTDHKALKSSLTPKTMQDNHIMAVCDPRNALNMNDFLSNGIAYKGFGRGGK